MMFFSHRICGRKEGAASGLRGSDERGGPRRPPPLARPAQDGGREAAAEHKGRRWGLTSDRKVCADFWAPTCSRYS